MVKEIKVGQWEDWENDVLLDAMELAKTPDQIASIVSYKTGRSEKSVIKRLRAIGFLHSSGQSFRSGQGFVRKSRL